MKFIDKFGNENNIPETDFENGRQDALSSLENTIRMKQNFLLEIKDQEEGITITKEIRNEQIKMYDEFLGLIKDVKEKNAERQYYAASDGK